MNRFMGTQQHRLDPCRRTSPTVILACLEDFVYSYENQIIHRLLHCFFTPIIVWLTKNPTLSEGKDVETCPPWSAIV